MTAANTTERGLIRTVALVKRATSVARLRGVAGVNQHDRNAAQLRFVRDVRPKLAERPIAVSRAYRFPNPLLCSLADMRQIFKRQRSASAFGFLYKLLGNRVVGVGLKAALFAAILFQAALCRLRTNGVKGVTAALIPLAHTFNRCAAVLVAVAIRRKVDHPKIDSQRRVNSIGCWVVNVARHKEIERAVTKHQIAFTLSGWQHLPLTVATDKRHVFNATVNRPDRNGLLVKVERQDTVIVGNTAVWSVRALHLPIQLVAIAHFGKTANNQLCRQAVVSLDPLIDQLLQIVLPKDLLFPRDAADVVARGVRCFQRALQGIGLFGRRLQFNLGDEFHILNCSTDVRWCQPWAKAGCPLGRAWRFLPRLKPVGFRA